MTKDEIIQTLEEKDWKQVKSTPLRKEIALLQKRLRFGGEDKIVDSEGHPVCILNGKLHIEAYLYETYLRGGGDVYRSAELEICGEISKDKWVKFSMYSLTWNELVTNTEKFTEDLLAAWDAACSSARK